MQARERHLRDHHCHRRIPERAHGDQEAAGEPLLKVSVFSEAKTPGFELKDLPGPTLCESQSM